MSDDNPLRKYRSRAEKIAIQQRNAQIFLGLSNVVIGALIALKTFGII